MEEIISVKSSTAPLQSIARLPSDPIPFEGFSRAQVEKIVSAACRGPSGDNIQPWRFEYTDDGRSLEAWVDAARSDFTTKVGHVGALPSIGAALENARRAAAGHFGRDLEWIPLERELRSGKDAVVARMVNQGPLKSLPDPRRLEAVFDRHTRRGAYDGQPLKDWEKQGWREAQKESLQAFPDVRIKLFEQEEFQRIAPLIRRAMKLLFEVPAIRSHVFDNIVVTEPGRPLPPDKMPLETLGVGPLDQLLTRFLKRPGILDLAVKLGSARLIAADEEQAARTASAFGLILASDTRVGSLLRGGAAMQKMWLSCEQSGLAVQPMTSPMLHSWFVNLGASDFYAPSQRCEASAVTKGFQELYAEYPGAVPVMFFRMGHAQPIEARTGRRPVEAILKYSAGSTPKSILASQRG